MPTPIPFTNNYQDLSTDRGFQFRFHCQRCGNGYQSSFQTNISGIAGDALRVAGNVFGGVLGRAAYSSYDVQRMIGGPAHDGALQNAVAEISPLFKQCGRCGSWVCEPVCWNETRNQCVRCSPKIDQEIAAIESAATIEQLRDKARTIDMTGGVQLQSAAASVACPACGKDVPAGKKFCEDCGANVQTKPHCPFCKTLGEPNQKFCGDCGAHMRP